MSNAARNALSITNVRRVIFCSPRAAWGRWHWSRGRVVGGDGQCGRSSEELQNGAWPTSPTQTGPRPLRCRTLRLRSPRGPARAGCPDVLSQSGLPGACSRGRKERARAAGEKKPIRNTARPRDQKRARCTLGVQFRCARNSAQNDERNVFFFRNLNKGGS